jgi:hypothetical protein
MPAAGRQCSKLIMTLRLHPSLSVRLQHGGLAATVNYRPALSSESALQNNKPATVCRKSQGGRKIGRGSQMDAWHQDGLTDWLSVVMWLWLCNTAISSLQLMFPTLRGGPVTKQQRVSYMWHLKKLKLNSVVWVRQRIIPTELPPLVGEVSANFCV